MRDAASPKANASAAEAQPPESAAAPIDSPGADLTGRTLGEFEILRKIGAGGMGQVYLARQLSLKRQVALKLLRKDLVGNAIAMKRFQAEAEAVATLNHPNIVQVYGAGESDGLRYMALEFVDGRNLREHLARKGPPELAIALSIMRQVVMALQKAHERGLVHRDIKPENILVTKKVEVKVTDFGLSRFFTDADAVHLTQSGVTLGTPLYLSPEQAQGHAVDHRSDLYSFGVTCYHLLSGEPPFRGTTAVEVALKHLTDQPKPLAELRPDLPAELCAMVHKLMEKKAGDRQQSARDLLRELTRVKDGRGAGMVPLSLSTSHSERTPLHDTAALSQSAVDAAPPSRWLRWVLAGCICFLAVSLGAIVAILRHPPADGPVPKPESHTSGMPEIRSPEKLIAPRERELQFIVKDRGANAEVWISAGIELGTLYLREGRLDDASARFEALEKEPFRTLPEATRLGHFAGRLGRAIVMAHRDNDLGHPQAAQESVKLFLEALTAAQPRLKPDEIRRFLMRHVELAQAASEALNRNALNGAVLPSQLNPLRFPRGLSKKD